MLKKMISLLAVSVLPSAYAQTNLCHNEHSGPFHGLSHGLEPGFGAGEVGGATYDEVPCTSQDGYVAILDTTYDNGYEAHVSALLAAFMADKKVRLVLTGCSLKRPRIVGVIMSR